MKRCLIILIGLIMLFSSNCAFAKAKKSIMPIIKYSGTKYRLYYSAYNPELGSFLNEYFKRAETETSWTELIAVHHYPTADNPIEQANEFLKLLNSSGIDAELIVDSSKEKAIITFIAVSGRKLPIIVEANAFKFEKSSDVGTSAFQYARRYQIFNPLLLDSTLKKAEKDKNKAVNNVNKVKMPQLVKRSIEQGKYVIKESVVDDENLDFS